MHADLASAEYLPSGQSSQLLAPALPRVSVTDPARQPAHPRVGSADHNPAEHGTHLEFFELGTDPAGHASQLVDSAWLYLPLLHRSQANVEFDVNFPEAQGVHLVAAL